MLAAAASRARSTANAGPATGAGPATPAAPIDARRRPEGPRAAWGDPAPTEAAAAPAEPAPAAEVKAPSGLSFKMAARAAALRARARAQLREQAREEGDSEGGDPVAAALRFVGGDDVEEAIEAYKARSELLDAADELLIRRTPRFIYMTPGSSGASTPRARSRSSSRRRRRAGHGQSFFRLPIAQRELVALRRAVRDVVVRLDPEVARRVVLELDGLVFFICHHVVERHLVGLLRVVVLVEREPDAPF